MDLLKNIEPKYSTLIQATVLTFLLVMISYVYDQEEKASAQVQAVAAMRR